MMTPAALVLAAGLLATTAACGAGDRGVASAGSATSTSVATIVSGHTSTTTVAPVARPARFKTVQSGFTVARPNDPAQPTMDVFVVRPVGRGPFPLIIFSHGFRSVAQSYTSALTTFARQGYVVVGPNFPYEDFRTHPADISLVIDRLSGADSPFPKGFLDLHHIAAAGHSIGGADAYGVTYNSCCRDRRITAAITFEGALGTFPAGTYGWRGPPLLIVLGDADPLIVPDTGSKIFANFTTPAYLLTVNGGGHGGGLDPPDLGYASVQATVSDFLAAYLRGDAHALRSLRSHRARPHTTLRVR